jgi:HPt (histidine-containing phosphotransfer) domain-containing protein
MDLPDLDPRAFQSLLKSGGKKKLDALLEMLKVNGPQRVHELLEADNLAEAQAAAKALKNSAVNLGLAALEDTCDQILAAKDWKVKHALAVSAQGQLAKGQSALGKARQGI